MANRPAPALVLVRVTVSSWSGLTRSTSVRAGLVQRARIVLLAADGVPNPETAGRIGVARQTVLTWRARYVRRGLAGLVDEERSGADHHRDAEAAAEESGGDGLVDPAAGCQVEGRELHGRQGVARV
jgi:hypothetical protein